MRRRCPICLFTHTRITSTLSVLQKSYILSFHFIPDGRGSARRMLAWFPPPPLSHLIKWRSVKSKQTEIDLSSLSGGGNHSYVLARHLNSRRFKDTPPLCLLKLAQKTCFSERCWKLWLLIPPRLLHYSRNLGYYLAIWNNVSVLLF